MNPDFEKAFAVLSGLFADEREKLAATETSKELTLHTRVASPFPQHKGAPMYFAAVKRGKAYVSLHLFPLYVCTDLKDGMSTELKKRMQGLTCFNFKNAPDAALLKELEALTKASIKAFEAKGWA